MLSISTKSIKFKIVLYSTLSLIIIGVLMNFTTYQYFNKILVHKVDVINNMNISNVSSQLDIRMTNLNDLTLLITNNIEVQKILDYTPSDPSYIKSKGVNVQSIVTQYIDSSIVNSYIIKAMVFNEKGLAIQSIGKELGYLEDYRNVLQSTTFKNLKENPNHLNQIIAKPVITKGEWCLPVLKPIHSLSNKSINGWLYMEINLDLILDIIKPYKSYNSLFITTRNNHILHLPGEDLDYKAIMGSNNNRHGEYVIRSYPIEKYNWQLYTVEKLVNVNMETRNMLSVFIVTIVVALITGLLIFIGASIIITRPIKTLKKRIKKISKKDFSYDAETENINGEIGEIGHCINNMAHDIEALLEQSIEMTNEKKNFEIAMLQSQVNPHFLYNTLNSIHWMATLQKNTGICKLVDALTNLLKNMAKSFSDKVTLGEELRLLDDYLTIQSIRYMESFEFTNNIAPELMDIKIVRMTLQPLVENAIFHGIEPKGKFGTITLDGEMKDDYLLLTITDDGVGMTEEEIKKLTSDDKTTSKSSINGIGFYNVHKRLQLIYGEQCGLRIKSEVSKYTTIIIKIPIEV